MNPQEARRKKAAREGAIRRDYGPLKEETNPTRGEMREYLAEAHADVDALVGEVEEKSKRLDEVEAAARRVAYEYAPRVALRRVLEGAALSGGERKEGEA